jgi:hypothetical protein
VKRHWSDGGANLPRDRSERRADRPEQPGATRSRQHEPRRSSAARQHSFEAAFPGQWVPTQCRLELPLAAWNTAADKRMRAGRCHAGLHSRQLSRRWRGGSGDEVGLGGAVGDLRGSSVAGPVARPPSTGRFPQTRGLRSGLPAGSEPWPTPELPEYTNRAGALPLRRLRTLHSREEGSWPDR